MPRDPRTSIKVDIDDAQAQSALRKLAGDFRREGAEIERVFGDRLNLSMAGLAAGVGATATAVVGLTAATVEFTRRQAEQIRSTRQLAENLGVNVEQFSALEVLSRQYGATGEDLADVIKDLSVRALELESDFKQFNLSVRDSNGTLLQGIPLFLQIADGISRKKNATEQAAIADILGNDAAIRLVEVLRLGRDTIQQQTREIIRNGEAIDEHTALVNERFIRAMNDATVATEALTREIGTDLAEAFTPAIEQTADFVRTYREDVINVVEEAREEIGLMISTVGSLAAELGDFAQSSGVLAAANALRELASGARFFRAIANIRELGFDGVAASPLPTDGVPQGIAAEGPGLLARDAFGAPPPPPPPPAAPEGLRRPGPAVPALVGVEDPLDAAIGGLDAKLAEQQREREALDEHLSQIVEAEREAARERIRIAEDLARRQAAQQELAAGTILGSVGSLANSIGQIETNLAAESGQRSEALFYLQQGISAVQAGVYTALAITRALAELGPIAGPIAAVAIGAAGAAQVAAILTASPGSPPSVGGVGANITSAPASASAGVGSGPRFGPDSAPEGGGRTINVTFNGPVSSRRARRELQDVLEGAA